MRCTVYRSTRKEFTYLYLADTMKIEDLPESLRKLFGEPELVMVLDLSVTEKMANSEPEIVIQNLQDEGFYLQLPPRLPIEEEISRKFS